MLGRMGRFFLLIPFLLIVTSIAFMGNTFRHIEKQMIEENQIVNKMSINMLLDEIEFLEPLIDGQGEYRELLIKMITMYDDKSIGSSLYCELFDESLQPITPRDPLTPDDPFQIFHYPDLLKLIENKERGDITLRLYKPDEHDLHIYFRWISLDGTRYLVVSGVSKYSLKSNIDNSNVIIYFSIIIVLSIGIIIFAGYYSSSLEREIYKNKMKGVQKSFRSFNYYKDNNDRDN